MRQFRFATFGENGKWTACPILPKWTNNQCTMVWMVMLSIAFLLLLHNGSGAWSLMAFMFFGGFREDKCVKCGRETVDGEHTEDDDNGN